MKKMTKKSKILVLFLTFSLSVIPFLGLTVSSADTVLDSSSITAEVPLPSYWQGASGNSTFVPNFSARLLITYHSSILYQITLQFINLSSGVDFTGYPIFPYSGNLQTSSFPFVNVTDGSVSNFSLNMQLTNSSSSMVDLVEFYTYKTLFAYLTGSISVSLPCWEIFLTSSNSSCAIFRLYGLGTVFPLGRDNLILYKSGVIVSADGLSLIDTVAIQDESYRQGFEDGKIVGAAEGNSHGYNLGYQEGQASVELANDYTFGSLLDAVFYAPLRMLYDALNFDVMGVNFYYVFTSLFILAIILTIIRIIV